MTRDDVQVVERRLLHHGFGTLLELRFRHRLFAGGMGRVIDREIYERRPFASVLLYDPARDAAVMVEQFRAGAYLAGQGPWLLEIVAGLLDAGETPEEVARREAVEEAGAEVVDLLPIARYMPSPGSNTEVCTIFCGLVDATHAGGIFGLPEEGEDIRAVVMARAELERALGDGRIMDGKTVIAVQWLMLNHARLRADGRA
jgi:ADP-ribose pyrophosphatase